jgi:hypothetical protein
MTPTIPRSSKPPAVVVNRYQADMQDQDHATAQTVGLMAEQIRKCAQDPVVQAAARNALVKYAHGPAEMRWNVGPHAACWATWWSIRHTLKFVSDDSLLRNIPTPNPPELELLVSPSVMVRARSPQGDCDDFTMLMCCFLEVLGVPWEIVTIAADPSDPERWSHVYAVAILEDGRRFPMDAAPPDAKFPGWEVPADAILRYQAWDADGQPVERQRPIKRMQGYRPARRRGLRGLGDTYQCDDDGANCVTIPDVTAGSGGTPATLCSDGSYMAPGYPCPSSGLNPSTAPNFFEKEFATLANAWTQIGSRVIAPTTTVTSKGVTITTPASSTAAASLLSSSGIGGISTGTILLLAGAAALMIFLAKK